MATYKGSISLVNMSDITAAAGVGLKGTEVTYAKSISGVDIPTEWSTTIPEVEGGWYLWTRTTFFYTDNSQSDTYTVSKQGEEGPAGTSSSTYRISASQTEILKFVSLDGNTTTFSPENIQFFIYKDSVSLNNEIPYEQITNISKDNFSLSVYDITSGEYIEIDKNFITLDEDQGCFSINLYQLDQSYLVFNIILNEDCVIKYSYDLQNEDGRFYLVNYLNVRYGIKKDMAMLSVEAESIVQAIQQTKLRFSAEGLTIYNGGFNIIDNNGYEVLKTTNGNLTVTGTIQAEDGYFKGELLGASGSFSGNITAYSGEIGGFIISEDKISSKKKYISEIINGEEVLSSNIVLNGTTGEIFAQDIILGTGAIVQNYIQLGDAYIFNPENNKDKFIEAGNICLKQNGFLNLGTIELFGGNKNVQAYLKSKNENWIIYEDGTAIFNNIYADNLHLKNTILEIDSVQSVGSLMLFKDSWTISEINNNKITLNTITNLLENDWVYSGKNIYKILSKEEVANTTILTLDKVYAANEGNIITRFGQDYNSSNPGFIISILGEQSAINDDRKFATGNAFSISDFTEENNTLSYRKRLILGNLDGAIDKNITGIGLYADNVFLNGSLTTKVSEDSFAGINTIDSATAKFFGESDQSRIIFWAGSSSSDNTDIQAAPFQVTEKGSIYASKGIFKDSIISDSTIQGADIYAARIHGGTTEEPNSLTIYDTSKGIIFKEGYNSTEEEIFAINTNGFQRNNSSFIEIQQNNISFLGDNFIVNSKNNSFLEITENNSQGFDISFKLFYDGSINEKSYQNFKNDKISFGFNQNLNREDSLIITKDRSSLKSNSVWVEKDVYFGTDIAYMQYKKVENGYDLFISE